MRTLLAILLLVGVALLGVGALFHPMLDGDAPHQLTVIAGTPYWRALHLAMLTGSACVMTGIWARQLAPRDSIAPAPSATGPSATGPSATGPSATAALVVITVGLALNAFDIAVMASAGTHMATAFAAGDAAIPPIYDATHLVGVMTARFGNGVVALGAVMLGWTEWLTPTRRPSALLAWLAALGGLIGVLAFDETSRGILGATALLCGWSFLTGILTLRPSDRSLH
jgi:hypothetical protein